MEGQSGSVAKYRSPAIERPRFGHEAAATAGNVSEPEGARCGGWRLAAAAARHLAAHTVANRPAPASRPRPEVLRRRPYAKPCDMWSLGVVAYMLLAGRRPFHSRDREEKIELILKGVSV